MLTDEDRKAAKDFASLYKADHSYPIMQAFLAGIEHERKRQEDKARDGWPYAQAFKEQAELNFQRQMNRFAEMFRKLTPVEQVGEKHWRIKDGHE